MWKKKLKRLTKCLDYTIIYIIFIFLNINKTFTKSITVSNKNELKEALDSGYSEIIINTSFDIDEQLINGISKTFTIMGKTVDTSLNFLNEENGFYFKLCKNIEIKNLKIIGNLVLENCTGIELSNIEFNGVIKSKFSSILFNNTTYHNLQNYKSPYGIYLDKSNFDIYDSKLYGSASITNFIIYSTNETPEEKDDYYRLSIKNTYMSGEYESGIIKADYMCNVTIEHSEFVNGFTKSHGFVLIFIFITIVIFYLNSQ